jgi:predicted DNA-binding transcriptional regulator AlpA
MGEKPQPEKARSSEHGVPIESTTTALLTAKEVAQQTGLSMETLAQWRSQKRGFQYVKISRNCVRYRQADLDCWVSERIVRTSQGPVDDGRRE